MKTLQQATASYAQAQRAARDAGNEARELLRRTRLENNVSLETLASMAGMSVPHLSNLERGTRTLTPEVLDKLHYELAIIVTNRSTARVVVEDAI